MLAWTWILFKIFWNCPACWFHREWQQKTCSKTAINAMSAAQTLRKCSFLWVILVHFIAKVILKPSILQLILAIMNSKCWIDMHCQIFLLKNILSVLIFGWQLYKFLWCIFDWWCSLHTDTKLSIKSSLPLLKTKIVSLKTHLIF